MQFWIEYPEWIWLKGTERLMDLEVKSDNLPRDQWEIGRFLAQFTDKDVENQYRLYKLAHDVKFVAIACMAMVMLFVFGITMDLELLPPELTATMVTLRIVSIVFCLILFLAAIIRTTTLRITVLPLILMTGVSLSFTYAAYQYTVQISISNNEQTYAVFIFIAFLIVATPIKISLATVCLIVGIALGLHAFALPSEFSDIPNVLFTCIGMGTLGYLFARTIHVMRRKEFATYIQLNEEVKRRGEAEEQLRIHQDLLEEIVKERTDQLRKSEMNLLQAQRMESIGQLAGGIAHDFNNLLLVILGYSDLVAESDDIQEIREYQKEVQSAAERGAEMAKQLLAFSRRQIMDITPVDIPALLTQLRNMIHPIVPANIDVEIRLPDEPIASMADYGQLEQALMNLVINARDAMPEGGSLQIGLSREALNDSFVDAHPWARAGEFAVIRVTDTGHGFSAETKTRIFEPFFTTKPEGQGTGLGLAMVFGTINQMNGFIHVYSEEGEGTEFKLYLPFLSEMIGKEKTESVEVGLTGSETILLVEDEPQVRALGSAVLRGAGYNVIEAEDGHEGMAVYGKHKDEIDLLFLDIVMPRMGGQDMMTALRENGDSIPILFTSGYSSSAIHTNFILQDGLELISKPYSPDLLKRKIREVLDRNAKLSS